MDTKYKIYSFADLVPSLSSYSISVLTLGKGQKLSLSHAPLNLQNTERFQNRPGENKELKKSVE